MLKWTIIGHITRKNKNKKIKNEFFYCITFLHNDDAIIGPFQSKYKIEMLYCKHKNAYNKEVVNPT